MVRIDVADIDDDEVGNAARGARAKHAVRSWLVQHENRVVETHVRPRQLARLIPHLPFLLKPESLYEERACALDVFVPEQKRSHSALRSRKDAKGYGAIEIPAPRAPVDDIFGMCRSRRPHLAISRVCAVRER